MNKLQQRVQQRGQGGFTLIELLVVIAILAILAGVVVFAVGNATDGADESACNTERRTISTAANAAKAAQLNRTTAVDVWEFLDTANAAGSGDGRHASKYFTVTQATTGNDRTVSAAAVAGATTCGTPNPVTYVIP